MQEKLLSCLAARSGGTFSLAVAGPAKESRRALIAMLSPVPPSDDPLCAEWEEDGASIRVFESDVPAGDACILVTSSEERGDCIAAEEALVRVASVPLLVVVDAADPSDPACEALRAALEEKYARPALAMRCSGEADEGAKERICRELLFACPVQGIDIDLPAWMRVLPAESRMISEILEKVREVTPSVRILRDCERLEQAFSEGDVRCSSFEADAATGLVRITLEAEDGMFYRVLGEECGVAVPDDLHLMAYVRSLREAKEFYDKFGAAAHAAKERGYGVVLPSDEELSLLPPELVRRGGKCGVLLKADATAYHILKVDVHTEVSPITGDAARGEEIAKGVMESYERDREGMWNTDVFGKTFKEMVRDGLDEKMNSMPEEARGKLRRAVTRIVNEGKGGVICILL